MGIATAPPGVSVSVLGPTLVLDASSAQPRMIAISRQDLRILTALATFAHGAEMVDAEFIEEHAWRAAPTGRALQSAIYRLRGVLGPSAIETRRRLVQLTADVAVDLDEFTAYSAHGDLDRALGLVRGVPLATMADHPSWREVRTRWAVRVDAVRDAKVRQLMDADQLEEAVGILVTQLAAAPHQAARWSRLVEAYARLGRRVDALRAVDQARQVLASVGLDLDASLVEREHALLSGATRAPGDPAMGSMATDVAAAAASSQPDQTQLQRFWSAAAGLAGREAELVDAVEAIDGGLDPVVALVGTPGAGSLRLARAIAATVMRRGWRIVVPGSDAELADAWGPQAPGAPSSGERVLVVADSSHRDPAVLRAAAQQIGHAASRRLLLRVLDGSGRIAADAGTALEAALGVPVHVVRVGPLRGDALARMAGRAAELLGPESLDAVTGGLAELAKFAAARAEEGLAAEAIAAQVAARRLSMLDLDAQRVLGAVAVLGGSSTRRDLAALADVSPERMQAITATLLATGWLAGATAERLALRDGLGEPIVAGLDPTLLDPLVERICQGLGDTLAALRTRVGMASLLDRADRWTAVAAAAGRLSWSEIEVDASQMCELVEQIIDHLARSEQHSIVLAMIRSRLAMVLRVLGDIDRSWRLSGASFRSVLRSGTASELFTIARDSVYPAAVAVTDDGEPGRGMVRAVSRRSDLGVRQRLEIQAIEAFYELARGDRRVGLDRALDLIGQAEATGEPDVVAAVAKYLTVDLVFERGLDGAAELVFRHEIHQGNMALATRSLVYLLCARMRAGVATFRDPLLAELMVMVDTDCVRSAEVRAAGVLTCAALLRVPTEWHVDMTAMTGDGLVSPLRSRAAEMFCTLATTPEWTSLSPVQPAGDPASWRVSAGVDRHLWHAARAAAASERDTAAAHLLSALSVPGGGLADITWAQQSPIVVTRLPVLALTLRDIGDRDLAARVLAAHVDLRRTDLSMLPGVHFGPASSWLALIAEVAGDRPTADELHGEAAQRLQALGARVLELA